MHEEFIDYYAVLEISPMSSKDEIKKAFYKQIRIYHPDKNQYQNTSQLDRCKLIIKAHNVLSCQLQRKQYDQEYNRHQEQRRTFNNKSQFKSDSNQQRNASGSKEIPKERDDTSKQQENSGKQNRKKENNQSGYSHNEYPNSNDFYVILGIEKTASYEDIKKAYFKLIDKYSPDNDNLYIQKKILTAYLVLSDPELRANYDKEINNNNIYIKWMKSHIKPICIIGGAFFLGFALYKTYKLIEALNEQSLRNAALISSAIHAKPTSVPVEPQHILLSISKSPQEKISIILEQLKDNKAQSTSSIVSSVASMSNTTFEATKTAAKWTVGSVDTLWKWSAGKLSSQDAGGQPTSSVASSVASISNATFEATKTAAKWTVGSVGTLWKWLTN